MRPWIVSNEIETCQKCGGLKYKGMPCGGCGSV
jgi:hypothetical protein